MATQMMVRVVLRGEFDPEEITRRLSVQPTETWRRGDLISRRASLRRKQDGWAFSTGKENAIDLGARIRGLLDLLPGRAVDFFAVCKDLSIEPVIDCAVYMYGSQGPAMCIDARTVAEITEFGAAIDIDVLVLGDDEEDETDR